MNPKTFIAFAAGVLVASGVAYYAAQPKKTAPAEEPKKQVAVAEQQPQQPETTVTPTPVAASSVASNVPSEPRRLVRTKPSPAPVPAEMRVAPVTEKQQPPAAAAPPVNQPLIMQEPVPPPPTETAKVAAPPPPPPAPVRKAAEPPKAATVTIPSGTLLNIRLQEKLSTEKNMAGDVFQATLDQPVVIDGFIIAERGARVQGKITELDRSGKVKGLARIVLELTDLNTSDGQRVKVQTSAFERKAESTVKKDALKVGLGAALGAAIGGIAGGGKGAATGAGVGGAAGAGGVLLTRGQAAELPVETKVAFRLQEPITLTEKLNN